jgi:hypothetical protein
VDENDLDGGSSNSPELARCLDSTAVRRGKTMVRKANDDLSDEPGDELGRIDRRRVEQHRNDDSSPDIEIGPIVLISIILVAGAFVTYLVGFSGQGQQTRRVHIHGTIVMKIDEEQVPVAQQRDSRAFHFPGNSQQWHVEAAPPFKEALAIVGVDISQQRGTYDGITYQETNSGTTISIEVNRRRVTPKEYVLTDGDRIRIIVNSNSTTS